MTGLQWITLSLVIAAAAALKQPSATVSVKLFKFRPETLVVGAGVPVTWSNGDEIEHTVTADSSSVAAVWTKLDGLLSAKGATYRTSITKPGVYAYHCERHSFMRGVVRVTSPGEKQ